MSVAVYSTAELEALWGAIDAYDTQVARDLFTLGVANRAAYLATYDDVQEITRPIIEAPRLNATPGWVRSAGAWVENLLYNCISNAGSDFAPEATAKRLRLAARRADAKITRVAS